jgi:hypothetical protein
MKMLSTRMLAIGSLAAALGSLPLHAVIVDLTTLGSTGTINGALFYQTNPQSTGTGVIDSFVQSIPGGVATTSHAYNTTVNMVLDNGSSDQFNHSITLGLVPIFDIGGTEYREFLLDINETNSAGDEFLSLDEIQLFVGGTANSSVETFTGGILDHDGTLIYQLDAGGNNWVALNYALNPGSGAGDMFFYVPNSLFSGFGDSSVVTLYSAFGDEGVVDPPGSAPAGNYGQSDGFEEWALREATGTSVPDGGATVLLLGSAFLGLAVLQRRMFA